MPLRFADRSVFITGAGAGIGRATALAFAAEGAAVALVDIDAASAEETRGLIEAAGGRAVALAADINDEAAVAAAFAGAVAAFGRIDHAVNNAGINQPPTPTADIAPDLWRRVIDVNVTGTWLCMREELRHMAPRGAGSIVNMASLAGQRPLATQSAYVASKHAVLGLTQNAALEYAGQGVRINAVAPGAIATAMMFASLEGLDDAARRERQALIDAKHPLNRHGQPEEVAAAVLYLSSDQAGFVTGHCFTIDGGRLLT